LTKFLVNKQILLGVTGSIAAYKSADLVRRLREAGAFVRVAMTENAKRFITPLTMQAVSGHPVHDDLFDLQAEAAMGHIELSRWADLIIIAPASADFISRLAAGSGEDLLSAICLAAPSPILVAPAMNQGMWQSAFTQHNIQILKQKDIPILGPADGSQACGDVGLGRMLEPAEIVKQASDFFATGVLSGLKVVITAGPTREPIDPIRFMTNGSSGKMGYALAQAAYESGAHVCLISGPVNLTKPNNIDCTEVQTAEEMYQAVMRKIPECDIFLAVAAVSDYRSEVISTQKIPKTEAGLSLSLLRNKDIVADVGKLAKKPFIVGFAAETQNVIENAKAKRLRKNMDMIIANEVSANLGMNVDDNSVTVIDAQREISLPLMSKQKLARQLIQMISEQFNERAE
jgi:phosphopantothenoylcysteine decarboxylase/phosphopantothenate--cysteine ligase